MANKNILIVGAGVAGLAIYRALRQRGLNATLVEKAGNFTEDGAGICLPGNAVAALQCLGLKHRLLSRAHQVSQIEYAKANGRTLALASLKQPPLNQQPFVALRRSALLELLSEGIDEVRFNCSPQCIEQTQEGTLVEFSDGHSQFYDLIIGADGIHSQVRQLIFGSPPAKDLGVSCWRFIAQLHDQPGHPRYLLGKDDAFMFYPLGQGDFYCYAQCQDQKQQLLNGSDEQLLQHFKRYEPAVHKALKQASRQNGIISGRLQTQIPTDFFHGNAVLIGDALHACPPSLQQGVAMALEDSITLARLLSRYPIELALPRYQALREKRISWVVQQSNKLIKLANKGSTLAGRLIRNRLIKRQGPINVEGWKSLLADDPLSKIP